MNPLILAIAIVAIPILVLTALRINAAIVFLSLCLGEVLVMFVSADAASTVGILTSYGQANPGYVSLGLLLVPAILTAFCMIGTVKGKLTQGLNLLPAIAVGALALLLVKPLLSGSLQSGIESTVVWEQVQGLRTIVVSASALISLFFLWIQRPKNKSHDEGKKHK
jgi:hypothetical protein